MANIESKNLLVAVKAYSRGNALPLDASEIYDSLAAAQTYAGEANAYAGQTIKVLENGKYNSYVLQPTADGKLTLDAVGAVKTEDLKKYVQIVSELPATGEDNIIYIVGTTGSIWNKTDSKYETIFKDLTVDLKNINDTLNTKAPIENPIFSGVVKVGDDEVAVKSYVDGLIAGIHSNSPKIVDSNNSLPTSDYKAGQTWRVAESGTYAGQKCEIGDVIICLSDYKADNASDNDFIVVQANIDGAVTSSAETVTDASVVVFDGVTGKIIKSSNISLTDLNDAVSKKHTHDNKTQLDSFTKTETELLNDAQSTANSLVETAKTELNNKLDEKADKSTTYTKTDIDGKITVIENNLNSKVATTDFNAKIGDLGDKSVKDFVESAINDASGDTTNYVDSKLGDITDDEGNAQTVKDYMDAGLAKKADKATTLAGYGITDAYTKTEVDTKVSADIATAKNELTTEIDKKAAQSDLDDVSGKVTTLIGEDENTSVRTIVSTEVAKIINDNDDTAIDTLEEIAAWIAAHPDSVATINASIKAIQDKLIGINDGEGTVKKYIDDAIAAKDLSAYATKEYVDAQDSATLDAAKAYIDNAITIVRF